MRYIQPEITGSFDAVATIQGIKGAGEQEGGTDNFSVAPAYPADE